MAQPAAASIARAMQDQRGRVSTRASCACRVWACGRSRWMLEIKIRCSLAHTQRACTSFRVEPRLRLILFVRLPRHFLARIGICGRLDTLSGRRVNSEHPVTRSVIVGPSGRLRARRKIETTIFFSNSQKARTLVLCSDSLPSRERSLPELTFGKGRWIGARSLRRARVNIE